MTETRIKYVFYSNIKSIDEVKQTARGRVDETTGQTVLEQQSLGWLVRITDSSGLSFGLEKPDFAVGDKLKMTVEKVP